MPSPKILFCIFLIITLNTDFVKSVVCPPDVCAAVECEAAPKCKANQVLKKGGFCSCCDQCFTILKEGEVCGTPVHGVILGVIPPTTECDTELVCHEGTCQNIKKVYKNIQ